MSRKVSFFVPGLPKPAGSKRAFALRKNGILTGRVAVTDDCKGSRPWKGEVSQRALCAMRDSADHKPMTGALVLRVRFEMPRPKGDWRTGARAHELKPSAPVFHIKKPDVLKLTRAVEDALTGIVYRDDAQITTHDVVKRYSDNQPTGCHITVEEL